MSVLPVGFGSSGIDTGDIPAALRFRRSASASITTNTNPATTSTYFCLFKQGALGAINPIFDGNIKINANNTITAFGLTTTAVARDPTSFHWMHVSNNGLVFDGVNLGAVTTSAITGLRLGYDGTNYADMYGARMCVVSGTSLPYTDFVTFNTTINEWVVKSKSAIKALVDAGDAESSMYEFDDATSLTTLGYDESSKANNATLNNFSLTAGTTYDHMLDGGAAYGSFSTLNSIYPSAANITNGNLTSGTTAVRASQNALAYDSKWEVTAGGSAVTAGVISGTGTTNTTTVTANKTFAFRLTTAGALDYKNVTDAGSWTSITTGLTGEQYPYGITAAANWNFGQAPLHASATYQSAAGGYFFDTTAGFKALCQRNLEEPAILNPEDHHIDIAVTKSGDTNFTLPWDADTYDTFFEIKRRDSAGDWYQIDGLRGYTKILKSNSTAAETTDANVLGISGTTGTLKSTLADGTYIVSATKAGLSASRQTNTDGSITSTVSRNVDSGFAIALRDGTGANGTFGHGLGAAIKFRITKARDLANGTARLWYVWHTVLTGMEFLYLDQTAAKQTLASIWNSTTPSSTLCYIGTENAVNNIAGGVTRYVEYLYADSAIQKSFSYTGNASTDGAYADVGFKMGRALLKCSTTTGNWTVLDSVRSDSNVADDVIYENLTNAEATSALADLTSRAIKFRIATDPNSAQTFVGHAWASVTGKYSLSR